MKTKTTITAIRSNSTDIISFGYGKAQTLFNSAEADEFSCGVYGWNFDVWYVGDIAVCSGYRSMPKGLSVDSKTIEKFEAKAKKIANTEGIKYETIKRRILALQKKFVAEVLKNK